MKGMALGETDVPGGDNDCQRQCRPGLGAPRLYEKVWRSHHPRMDELGVREAVG